MSLRFILGGSGSGKTHRCLFQIKEALSQSTCPIIYIVPEQYSLEAERELTAICQGGALTRVNVLSFQRLAFNIFSKCGGTGLPLLDDTGKIMLLRKILSQLAPELKYFGNSAGKQGFMDSLASMITEFYRYCITEETLEELLPKISKESLRIKMLDLMKIYKAYKNYAEAHYLSTDHSLGYFSNKLDEFDYLKDALVWVDGFYGFTPQEYNVLQRLTARVKTLTISLTVDKPKIEKIRPLDPFFETKTTLTRLTQLAEQTGTTIEKPLFLKECIRHKSSPEFLCLAQNFFSYKSQPYPEQAANIVITSVTEKYEEITQLAEEIAYLVYEKGYRYNEIAVISSAIMNYETPIKTLFDLFEIPYFSDKRRDICSYPLTELILGAVEVIAYNRNYESVFRFLKTGLTPLTQDETDILENYALAYGIKGYKWDTEFKYGFESGQFSQDRVNSAKKKLAECLQSFRIKKHMTVKDYAVSIFEMLEFMKIEERITSSDKNAKEYAQVWKKICGLFDKTVEILGDEKVTAVEFLKILEAGLKSCDMGIIPASQDQVIVGDLERTRLPNIKALFIIGTNDESLIQETSVISDEERRHLLSAGIELAPDKNRKLIQEQLLQYTALTKPTEYLYLSYPNLNGDGKALRPSLLISKLQKLFPQRLYEKKQNQRPKPSFSKMGKILRNYYTNEALAHEDALLMEYFAQSKLYEPKLKTMKDMVLENKEQTKLHQDTVKRLYSKTINSSVSRLERFVKCPFSYFVQYCLCAKERPVFEVNPMDIGSLFHEILDNFSKLMENSKSSWRNLTPEKIEPLIEECMESLSESLPSHILDSKAGYRYILKRVKRIASKSVWALSEHIKRGELEPYASEVAFDDSSPLQAISINLNNKNLLKITGRIDRLDVIDSEGNRFIRILDYKSGRKRFDLSDIYFGMQMQLLLYLDALLENGANFFGQENIEGKILPGGVFYFNIDDPIVESDSDLTGELLSSAILSGFKMSGLVLADPDLVKKMDNQINGHSNILPVYIKKDNEFGSVSQVASLESFDKLRNFVIDKIKDVGEQITDGQISINPYKKGKETGCDYCIYKAICGFEPTSKATYNHVKKIKSVAEIVQTVE